MISHDKAFKLMFENVSKKKSKKKPPQTTYSYKILNLCCALDCRARDQTEQRHRHLRAVLQRNERGAGGRGALGQDHQRVPRPERAQAHRQPRLLVRGRAAQARRLLLQPGVPAEPRRPPRGQLRRLVHLGRGEPEPARDDPQAHLATRLRRVQSEGHARARRRLLQRPGVHFRHAQGQPACRDLADREEPSGSRLPHHLGAVKDWLRVLLVQYGRTGEFSDGFSRELRFEDFTYNYPITDL